MPQADLLREACIDGGERRRPRLGLGHGAAARVCCTEGKRRGEEEQQVEGVLFNLPGGPGRKGSGSGGHGGARPWHQ